MKKSKEMVEFSLVVTSKGMEGEVSNQEKAHSFNGIDNIPFFELCISKLLISVCVTYFINIFFRELH